MRRIMGTGNKGEGQAIELGAFSDSETTGGNSNYYFKRGLRDYGATYSRLDGNQTDEDIDRDYRPDEFGESTNMGSRIVRTGRQRKKLAARSKGGEFQQRRRKRRVYFCCISSEINVQKLYDYLVGAGGLLHGWKYQLHCDVLHLFKSGSPVENENANFSTNPYSSAPLRTPAYTGPRSSSSSSSSTTSNADNTNSVSKSLEDYNEPTGSNTGSRGDSRDYADNDDGFNVRTGNNNDSSNTGKGSNRNAASSSSSSSSSASASSMKDEMSGSRNYSETKPYDNWTDTLKIGGAGAQEVFVFDFGAAVFWGFTRGEETNLLKTIRMFVTKGMVGALEFQSGEDDVAFTTSPETDVIIIANDVITLPEETLVKQRLSVSFAIAQSTVLAIFEARIDRKVEEYKYIPETLAACGKVHLSERQLGIMIGEVFVIRHYVNLHTEILDTPDFFWKEEKFEEDYKLVMRYLEMSARTEVLNKRLDMLRELLDVLQQQMENSHAVKLEWIVIWLIVIEVVLQGFAIGGETLGWWKRRM